MLFKTSPGHNREALGFRQAVLSAFDFLTKEYGFRLTRTESTFVRYESSSVFVNIYHGRASFELGVEIGQLTGRSEEEMFSIGEILELASVREQLRYSFFQVSDKEGVEEFVPKLAKYVREYAGRALKGEDFVFKQLRKIQSQNSRNYLKGMELGRIREQVEEAWQKKDYALIIKLYGSVKEDLTEAEIKKLEYAKKKLER